MRIVAALVAGLALASGAAAQTVSASNISASALALQSEPVTLGGGRVVLGGDVAAAVAPEDEGYFNYTNYEQTTLRQIRLGLSGLVRVTERISILGELRSENFEHIEAFGLYARIRPFPRRRLDVQIGRVPPTFGSFSRRAYGQDNPLIGSPMAYQYLTSLRADAAPANADELLRMRARGWRSSFTVGNTEPDHGLPLVNAFSWDTGVQVTSGWRFATISAAVTNGTPSNPRVSDDNSGKQIATRFAVTPAAGLVIGTSFARGEFLSRRVRALIPESSDHRYPQRAHGVDIEYSRDHWVVRGDVVLSEWQMPLVDDGPMPLGLRALGTTVEGRYTFLPGVYAAARVDHIGFSRIAATGRLDEWDAPVRRVEVGGGYYLQRNLVAKTSVQFNARDGGRVTESRLLSAQLSYWF
jgi:hypothetical protein